MCALPGVGVGLEYFPNRLQLPRIGCSQNVFNNPGNLVETDAAFQKRGYGDLIGCIQRHGFGTTRFYRLVGKTQTREFIHVWGAEVQMTQVTDGEAHI